MGPGSVSDLSPEQPDQTRQASRIPAPVNHADRKERILLGGRYGRLGSGWIESSCTKATCWLGVGVSRRLRIAVGTQVFARGSTEPQSFSESLALGYEIIGLWGNTAWLFGPEIS